MFTIDDYKQRQQALSPTKSFIVQAPAGSGKTELLIQRFLTLLSSVKSRCINRLRDTRIKSITR